MMNSSALTYLSAAELAAAALPPRPVILDPIIAAGSMGLVYGPGGVGKSLLALGIASAAASGGSFLGWHAPRAHKVLYLDGEMSALDLQERLALFGPPPPLLKFWLATSHRGPVLDLSSVDGLVRLTQSWDPPELLVIDNLSSLAGVVGDDPERWYELRRFLAAQRRRKRTVLMVHHAARDGSVRGSNRRTDGMDLVLALRRSPLGDPTSGARFEIHFEKTRTLHGAALEPVVAHLRPGTGQWHVEGARTTTAERGVALLRQGMSAEATAVALGISPSSAYRLQRQARRSGRIPARPARTDR